jgi:hypothetical protein
MNSSPEIFGLMLAERDQALAEQLARDLGADRGDPGDDQAGDGGAERGLDPIDALGGIERLLGGRVGDRAELDRGRVRRTELLHLHVGGAGLLRHDAQAFERRGAAGLHLDGVTAGEIDAEVQAEHHEGRDRTDHRQRGQHRGEGRQAHEVEVGFGGQEPGQRPTHD